MSSLVICEGCNHTVRMGLNRKSIPLKWVRISWTEREVLRGSMREVGKGVVDLCEECRAQDVEAVLVAVQASLEEIEEEEPEDEEQRTAYQGKRTRMSYLQRKAVVVRPQTWEVDKPVASPKKKSKK